MSWRDSQGRAVASRGPAPLILVDRAANHQLGKVDALIAALQAARLDASRGLFFASHAGMNATSLAHDLFEVAGLHTLAEDIAHVIGEDGE
jgi:hypothetical protein